MSSYIDLNDARNYIPCLMLRDVVDYQAQEDWWLQQADAEAGSEERQQVATSNDTRPEDREAASWRTV